MLLPSLPLWLQGEVDLPAQFKQLDSDAVRRWTELTDRLVRHDSIVV